MCEGQLERTKPEYEESESSHSDLDELQKTEIDLTDPGNWPGVENMTDQQRSLFSSQAALLAENHPENIEFRATERNGRHLTSSMWYRTLPNCERDLLNTQSNEGVVNSIQTPVDFYRLGDTNLDTNI
nr:unnamed protein product [Callosobruchus chinensis]